MMTRKPGASGAPRGLRRGRRGHVELIALIKFQRILLLNWLGRKVLYTAQSIYTHIFIYIEAKERCSQNPWK